MYDFRFVVCLQTVINSQVELLQWKTHIDLRTWKILPSTVIFRLSYCLTGKEPFGIVHD